MAYNCRCSNCYTLLSLWLFIFHLQKLNTQKQHAYLDGGKRPAELITTGETRCLTFFLALKFLNEEKTRLIHLAVKKKKKKKEK